MTQSNIHTWIPCSIIKLLSHSCTFMFLRPHYKFMAQGTKNINNTMKFMIYTVEGATPNRSLSLSIDDWPAKYHRVISVAFSTVIAGASPHCILGTYFGAITLTSFLKVFLRILLKIKKLHYKHGYYNVWHKSADFSVILTETAGENQGLNNAGPILRRTNDLT